MSFNKSDGAKIKLTFSEPLIGNVAGNEAAFTVIVPEYDYVPGGTISNVVKTVASVRAGAVPTELMLEMPPLSRFESAAGTITVNYDGTGNLQGEGGSVAAFAQAFTPTDLIPKPDQNDAEHIEVKNIAAVGTLTKIYYTNTAVQDMGHIEIKAITATGVLTHIKNI